MIQQVLLGFVPPVVWLKMGYRVLTEKPTASKH